MELDNFLEQHSSQEEPVWEAFKTLAELEPVWGAFKTLVELEPVFLASFPPSLIRLPEPFA